MASNYVEWYLQLVDVRTQKPIDDDTGIYNVLTQNDPAEITIYSSDSGASQANPGTMTNGIIRFWTDSATTTVDISVVTAGGSAYFLEDVVISDHRILVNTTILNQVMVVPYNLVGASISVDTGFSIPATAIVRDVWIRSITLGTGARLDVGTSNDPNGFIVELDVTTTGYKVMAETLTSITVSGSIGALLVPATATNAFNRGGFVGTAVASTRSVVYTNITVCSTAGAGYIFLKYERMPA